MNQQQKLLDLQKRIKKEGNFWNLKQYPKVNGGIVIIEPYTGDVKALVGGFNFKSSEFNRVTQAKRQPGSAFKPIVYAAALENGYSPNSIILDAPFVESQGIGLKNWKPENYGKKFYGPSTLRKGIEYSRNLMTVRIAKTLGLDKILDLSNKLEIYDDVPELLSVSLGAVETSLINLTSAYSSFVNGGKKVKPNLISRIQDRRGKTIYKLENKKCIGCDQFSHQSKDYPDIRYENDRIFSELVRSSNSLRKSIMKIGSPFSKYKTPLSAKNQLMDRLKNLEYDMQVLEQ